MRRKSIIRLENVSTTYEGERRPAIKRVNLILSENELLYVVGPNAAGKTTLLETINGLLQSSRGHVFVFDLDVRRHGRKVRRELGYVPQDFMVNPGEPYTALDIVMMGRYGKIGVLHRPDNKDLEKAMEAMKHLGIDELADRSVGKLSGGQQQKVMIARALVKDPKVLLLDEPFSNLDPDSRERIPKLIARIHGKGVATIIVTHDVSRILKQCRRVVVMKDGRIVADDNPERALTVFESPLISHPMEAIP